MNRRKKSEGSARLALRGMKTGVSRWLGSMGEKQKKDA